MANKLCGNGASTDADGAMADLPSQGLQGYHLAQEGSPQQVPESLGDRPRKCYCRVIYSYVLFQASVTNHCQRQDIDIEGFLVCFALDVVCLISAVFFNFVFLSLISARQFHRSPDSKKR